MVAPEVSGRWSSAWKKGPSPAARPACSARSPTITTTPVSLQNDVVGNPGLGGEAKWASVLDASGNRAVVAATLPSNGSINDVWTVDAAGNTTRIDTNVNGLVFST